MVSGKRDLRGRSTYSFLALPVRKVAEWFWCKVRSQASGSQSVILGPAASASTSWDGLLEMKSSGPPGPVSQKLKGEFVTV